MAKGRLHSVSGVIDDGIVEPYEFSQSVSFLRGFGPMSGQQEFEGQAVTKAVMIEGKTVVFRVSEGEGANRKSKLRYELFSEEPLTSSTEKDMVRRIGFLLSLGDDVGRFYAIAKKDDPVFYPLVEKRWGLHQVKFPSLLEISCWALLSQRIQRPIALRMKRAITQRFGGNLELDGRTYWAFPDYASLKEAKSKELLEATRNQRATLRLSSLLTAFEELDEEFLKSAPYDKATARLQKVKGIGDWSSQFILFRGLGRMGRLQPINIRPLAETIKRVYGSEGRQLEDVNSTYGEWSGYWSLYLWASTMHD